MESNGLTVSERKLSKKMDVHAWIASIIAVLGVLIVVVTIYGKANSAIDNNASDHKRFASQDSIQNLQITQSLRTLNVMYVNMVKMSKVLKVDLTKEEEIFLNQLIK